MMPSSPYSVPAPLVTIGRIEATATHVVTPTGAWPLAQADVTAEDHTRTTTHTPAWAIIMVIVFIWFFLLSLLFLFARESRTSGTVLVKVWVGGNLVYTEQIAVVAAPQVADVISRTTYLQNLIGAARARAAGV